MTSRPAAASSGLAFALASATFYGANVVAARLAADAGVSGVSLVVYRIVPMIALAAVALAAARSFRFPRGERTALVILGLATSGVGTAYFSAVAFVPVTVAVVVFYTYPALIVLADPLFGGAPLDPTRLCIVALAVAGVVLVVGPAWDGLDPRGLVLAGVASLATATQFIAAARCPSTPLMTKVLVVHLIVLPAVVAIGFASATLNPPGDLTLAPVAAALSILGYVFGFLFQVTALARASAVVVGIAFCLEPVVAAATASVFLGERLGAVQMVGAALVLAAVLANALRPPAPRPVEEFAP